MPATSPSEITSPSLTTISFTVPNVGANRGISIFIDSSILIHPLPPLLPLDVSIFQMDPKNSVETSMPLYKPPTPNFF
jgi:hypothetical protein